MAVFEQNLPHRKTFVVSVVQEWEICLLRSLYLISLLWVGSNLNMIMP